MKMRFPHTYRLSNRGFTLVELLVVIAILGILVAIGVPTFMSTTYPHIKLTRTARDIYTTLQYARGKAVGMTQDYGVRFDLSADPETFTVVTRSSSSDPWQADSSYAKRTVESGVNIFDVTLSGSTTYTTGTTGVIVFKPVGTATEALIRLQSIADPTDKYKITVSATTGRVQIVKGW